jgi:Resolvase, N terminal domain
MLNADGREESTQDQGLETVRYIKDNKLGRTVRSYTDIASGFHEDANRPDYENALDDLRAGVIGGIAVWHCGVRWQTHQTARLRGRYRRLVA